MTTRGVTATSAAIGFAGALRDSLASVVLGAPEALTAAVVAVLAGGHLLIDDVPGVGKTMLAKAVAASVDDARLARIQGHPDLLPSDIAGVSVYSAETRSWEFKPGPVFANVLLFDELNRTPPRSQAALLEAMEEGQVTVDGQSWPLPEPHLVLATQNPVGQSGTYPLVESQMDRFLLATRLGYPDAGTEARLALARGAQPTLETLSPIGGLDELIAAQRATVEVYVAPPVAEYAVEIVRATRELPAVVLGASPRAAIALVAAGRAHAVLEGRDFTAPGDVKAMAPACLGHRLVTDAAPSGALTVGRALVEEVLASVPAPRP